jgi:GT2 family glycosyltransferase/glycosyltransferase involved in cell wall biosynthesis
VSVRSVDIVVPVYTGVEETRRCLETALATADPAWARLVVVNDGSPDPEISALLRDFAGQHDGVVLLENAQNLGFVATANRGMQYDAERDVVLLNSDVEVANDWLHRLRDAAYHHPRAGSLTPFANNATICSFPNFCKDNALLFGLGVAEIDRVFAEQFSAADAFEVPTGVGCCMYLRRDCLNEVGLFDVETFGRGYGEENDWCQRAQRAGWRNLHLANCFVYHKGGVSFADEQTPRVARAMALLDERYPRYHADIQAFIARDPARGARTGALLALLAAQQRPKILCLSHKLGGGAQQHVDELARLYAADALFVQLTPALEGKTVALSVFDAGVRLADGLHFSVDGEFDTLVALLRDLGIGRVHFHHTMGLHPRLWVLASALGCSHDLTIHDYYLLNGNPTLTDADARFVGDNVSDFDQRCAGHYPLPDGVSAEQWRASQALLIEQAERVIFPSADCAARFQRFFPVRNAVTAWHPDFLASQPYPQPVWRHVPSRPLKVLVVGAISREKGADVLESVADELAASGLVEFHLLGYAYRALGSSVVTHGPYANAEAWGLIEEIAPDVVWFPAQWPETYSYTLSLALHLGLPVVVPDIGAFVERVSGRALSTIMPWDTSTLQWGDLWQRFARGERPGTAPESPVANPDASFYAGAYLAPVAPRQGAFAPGRIAALAGNLHAGTPRLSRSERLLGLIWRISRHPLVARLVSWVPFRVQQAIKRRLSARPMHDIVR